MGNTITADVILNPKKLKILEEIMFEIIKQPTKITVRITCKELKGLFGVVSNVLKNFILFFSLVDLFLWGAMRRLNTPHHHIQYLLQI